MKIIARLLLLTCLTTTSADNVSYRKLLLLAPGLYKTLTTEYYYQGKVKSAYE